MKKILLGSFSVLLGSVNYSSAFDLTDKISSSLSFVGDFFANLTDTIGNLLSFLWSVVSFIGYGIKTGLSYMRTVFDHIFGLSSWYDFFGVFRDLSVFLGVDVTYFVLLFFVAFILVIFSFLSRLVFGKLNFFKRDKG